MSLNVAEIAYSMQRATALTFNLGGAFLIGYSVVTSVDYKLSADNLIISWSL